MNDQQYNGIPAPLNEEQEQGLHGLKVASKPKYLTDAENAEQNDFVVLSAPKQKLAGSTNKEDIALFERMLANTARAHVSRNVKDSENGKAKILAEALDFEVAVQSTIQKADSLHTAFQFVGKRVTTTSKSSGKSKVEIFWNVSKEDIERFDIDNPIKYPEPPRKKTHAEKLGITDEELNKRQFLAKVEELPKDKFDKLLQLLDSL